MIPAMPTLHPDWWLILTRAWSMRLMLFALVCDLVAFIIGWFIQNGTATMAMVVVAGLANLAAGVVRLFTQSNMPRDA